MENQIKCLYCQAEDHVFSESCPKYIITHALAEKEREQWNRAHAACPNCGNTKLVTSLAGPIHIVGKGYRDDINYTECEQHPEFNINGCGWRGMRNELVPKSIEIWD